MAENIGEKSTDNYKQATDAAFNDEFSHSLGRKQTVDLVTF